MNFFTTAVLTIPRVKSICVWRLLLQIERGGISNWLVQIYCCTLNRNFTWLYYYTFRYEGFTTLIDKSQWTLYENSTNFRPFRPCFIITIQSVVIGRIHRELTVLVVIRISGQINDNRVRLSTR